MVLSSQRYEALSPTETTPELVLLHGWGLSSVVWDSSVEALRALAHVTTIDLPGFGQSAQVPFTHLDDLLAQIHDALPKQALLMGFSLGGMLAVQLAAKYPDAIQGVMTIASNARFTALDEWPNAMSEEVFEGFYASAEQSMAVTLKRFLGLQSKGGSQEKVLLKRLRAMAAADVIEPVTALGMLRLLARLDNREILTALTQPALHILASHDELVPSGVVSDYALLGQQTALIDGACHTLFLSQSEACLAEVAAFIQQLPSVIHPRRCQKAAVARSFSRAAATYDDVAELQRNVGERLLSYLPEQAIRAMDLGCGTGHFLSAVARTTQCDQLLALDLAEGMLSYAREHHSDEMHCQWIGGDAEALPLANDSVSVIFSSLAIQWCEDLPALFSEIERVLEPGGRFVFSTLGPETLDELRSAWRTVDDYVHVNRFEERAVLEAAMSRFPNASVDEQTITLTYQRLTELTRELKSLGAHNVNTGRPGGLMGKAKVKLFREAYESFRNADGLLPATYQVWYGSVVKPLAVSQDRD